MSYLINRSSTARLKCLHNIMKFAVGKYKLTDIFNMSDLMYNAEEKNIHHFCDLLTEDKSLKLKYCPYLENPLSDAGCNLTNGVLLDSTRHKEISNTINSLDALGFLERIDRNLKITQLGLLFAKTKYENTKMHEVIKKAVLNYGLCIGVLHQIKELDKQEFSTNEIYVGYPVTDETYKQNNQNVIISSGSQPDANTRTRSCILAWLTAAGFIVPSQFYLDNLKNNNLHNETLKYNLSKTRNLHLYKVLNLPLEIFESKFTVNNPLNYDNFTKLTGALRENGQKASREITMQFENTIKNRRLAIVYLFNKAFLKKKKIDFSKLVKHLIIKPEYFVIDKTDFERVLQIELQFANNCGIPYKIHKNLIIEPIVSVNEITICKNAPDEVIEYLNKFKGFVK